MIRALLAVGALVLAAVAVAVAIDVGRWEHARDRPPTIAGRVAENLLGTTDQVALTRAVRAFVDAENVQYGFDSGQAQARARALAETRLADVASSAGAAQASQAGDLLGVLAWGGVRAPVGVVDPADRAVGAFTDAARLDPSNVAARFNLEIALRALQSRGVRHGPSPSSGPRGTGHSGAGAGTPGSGY